MSDEAVPAETSAADRPRDVFRLPAFAFFWSATTIRAFGSSISGVAIQVLIVTVLQATPAEISVLSALSVAPYVFLGLIVGALMDRWSRQRTLVITSIGRAVALASVVVLLLCGALNFWSLAIIILMLGVLVLFADSASQPLLPRIVPRDLLVIANARLGQSSTVAGTAGPALGGALLNLLGAPILFAVDAVITALSAVLQSRIRVEEPKPAPRAKGHHVGHDIAEGMRYTYGHETLRPLALSVHTWFLGNSIVVTLFGVFVLRELHLAAWAYGIALAFGAVGGFLGALIAARIGAQVGTGWAIFMGRALGVVPWFVLAAVPVDAAKRVVVLVALVSAVQFVYSLAIGIEDANDTGYRQAVAPDAIQGRMNSTIRTVNRVVFLLGALLAGLLVTLLGYRLTFGIAALIFAIATLIVGTSPLRKVRHTERPGTTL